MVHGGVGLVRSFIWLVHGCTASPRELVHGLIGLARGSLGALNWLTPALVWFKVELDCLTDGGVCITAVLGCFTSLLFWFTITLGQFTAVPGWFISWLSWCNSRPRLVCPKPGWMFTTASG